jgi:catechol 2,3-dioxygenase-like lactoylglutathione lyase family enzyme
VALRRINLVSVPVNDQDEAKAFYAGRLGFTEVFDYVMPAGPGQLEGQRWVMLAPPGGGAAITLTTWFDDLTPGTQKLSMSCEDVAATRAGLQGRGVGVSDVTPADYGDFFEFDDPDGNHWLVIEERRPPTA